MNRVRKRCAVLKRARSYFLKFCANPKAISFTATQKESRRRFSNLRQTQNGKPRSKLLKMGFPHKFRVHKDRDPDNDTNNFPKQKICCNDQTPKLKSRLSNVSHQNTLQSPPLPRTRASPPQSAHPKNPLYQPPHTLHSVAHELSR